MYITYLQPLRYRQITFEEILSGISDVSQLRCGDSTATFTVTRDVLPAKLQAITNANEMLNQLRAFNVAAAPVRENPNRREYYNSWPVPKKSDPTKFRWIDAPQEPLKGLQYQLLNLLNSMMIASYHTTAYAYVPNRDHIRALRKHQRNDSYWFLKLDFSGFFPSITPQFILSMLGQIYPFAQIMQLPGGRDEMAKAIDLCILDGGLPQGTPISPWLTNVIMIPFDHIVSNALAKFTFRGKQKPDHLVYTRYADDIHISCHVDFDYHQVEQFVLDTIRRLGAPLTLNTAKTHYGSRCGSNHIFNAVLNKDNEITIGHEKKKRFKAALTSYILDRKNGSPWSLHEVQVFAGHIAEYRQIERSNIDAIIRHYNQKFGVDVMLMLRQDMSA